MAWRARLILLASLAATRSSASPVGTICLGALLTNSGSLTGPGAVEMALAHVNADPALLPGYRLELVPTSKNACDSAVGCVAAVDEMLHPSIRPEQSAVWSKLRAAGSNCSEADVVAFIGPVFSSVAVAILPLLEAAWVATVSGSTTSIALEGSGRPNRWPTFLRTAFSSSFPVKATAQFLFEQNLGTEVALLSSDDAFCRPSISLIHTIFEEKESLVTLYEFKSLAGSKEKTKIEAMMLAIKFRSTRTVVTCSYPTDTALVLDAVSDHQLNSAGWVWVTLYDAEGVDTMSEKQQAAFNGFLWLEANVAASVQQREPTFFQELQSQYGIAGGSWADAYFYDAVKFVATALNSSLTRLKPALDAGGIFSVAERRTILWALRNATLQGVSGDLAGSETVNELNSKPVFSLKNYQHPKIVHVATLNSDHIWHQSGRDIVWPGGTTVKPVYAGCRPGMFWVKNEWNCVNCPRSHFQPLRSQQSCSSCASRRETWASLLGAVSEDQCVCVYGTYQLDDTAPSQPCQNCPSFGTCQGRLSVPECQDNFFRMMDNATTSGQPGFTCEPCRGKNFCNHFPGNASQRQTSNASYMNCTAGHDGVLCEKCVAGFRYFSGTCEACDMSKTFTAAILIIILACVVSAAVFFVLLKNMDNPRMGASVSHMAEHAQMIVIVAKLPFSFPDSAAIFQLAELGAADPKTTLASSPSCILPDSWFSYQGSFWIIVGTNISLYCALIFVGLICSWRRKWNTSYRNRKFIQGLFVTSLLIFPPLFSHGCNLFSFMVIAGNHHLTSDLDIIKGDDQWTTELLPWAISSLVLSLGILLAQLVCFLRILNRTGGMRALFSFDESYGGANHAYFRTLGALFGHSKRTTLGVLWFLIRYAKRMLAIVIVTVGSANGNTRASYLILLIGLYVALLLAVQPYAIHGHSGEGKKVKFKRWSQRGENNWPSLKRRPMQEKLQNLRRFTSHRYRVVEVMSSFVQALTVCMMLSGNNNEALFPDALVATVTALANLSVLVFIVYNWRADKVMEQVSKLRSREIWASISRFQIRSVILTLASSREGIGPTAVSEWMTELPANGDGEGVEMTSNQMTSREMTSC